MAANPPDLFGTIDCPITVNGGEAAKQCRTTIEQKQRCKGGVQNKI